ncbi:methionine synthase II (cobalamin-independent) [Spinactinospora alkalitolerans]|uniref:Methionine synthase II (Cobalamin-independent) n=1 Tax=Spinactinospora alkalitolerans TaxID=687207 RepID=A0A852TSX9_9ACTN|nr:methionine synthase [Spinactinospora alkalitolerans]NYE45853.1 methionine synthase II (cobalamin-independent) [Spinactinospora alkalitolerans]
MSDQQHYPWPLASATGVGSLPGTDPGEAVRTVLGELPELPHLPELPDRGAGADIIGRAAAALVEFPVEVQPSGWRVAQRPGRDLGRARGFLSYDLDALEEHAGAYSGPLKIQIAGPWTLAAAVELRNGEKLLADLGAVDDLCESFIEGLRAHIADVRKRVPGGAPLVQIDEPSLPAALLGAVPTASGYGRLRAVERVTVEERLRAVFAAVADAGAFPMAHCCAPGVPVDLLRRSGARALGLDATLLTRDADEAIGTAVEDGIGLLLGVVPGADAVLSAPAVTVDPVRELWHRIGFDPELAAEAVVTTPTCGLAGASPRHARAALELCRKAARVLREEPRR